MVSDGLNAHSRSPTKDTSSLFSASLRTQLAAAGYRAAPETIVVQGGRVRVGYRIGELLFGEPPQRTARAILHVIGERPGTGHHAFSVYITAPP